ncbi:MAG: hypothetical protein WCO25_02510 [Candidatus Uhrbacteria bacterium]
MVKTPQEIVAETVGITKEFERKLAELEARRKEIVASAIRSAEQAKMSAVRQFIHRLFGNTKTV